MSSDLFADNLQALKSNALSFSVINRIKSSADLSSYCVETAKNQMPVFSVKSGAAALSYHSRYNPLREAESQVNDAYEGQNQVLLIGLGMGYCAEALLKKLPPASSGAMLHIVEPDENVLLLALRHRDLTGLLKDERVRLYTGIDFDLIGENWDKESDWRNLDDFCLIEHPPTLKRFGAFVEKLIDKVKYLCRKKKGNLITLMSSGSEYHSNNFANLNKVFGLPGVSRLFGRFKGVPAIVVAAGPSLDKNVDVLKKVKGRLPIIAVDTALRQLAFHGISPDIVCAADSCYENSLDFVGVENMSDVILAAEPMTHPDILRAFHGPKMVMTFGGGLYKLYKRFREDVGELVCWGSIATSVFDLARRMGADPIILIGQDLSFQDGKLHASGSYSDDMLYERVDQYSSLEHETALYIHQKGKIKYTCSNGSILYSDVGMHMYKKWFEEQFRQADSKIINATEGGVVTENVVLMPFAKAAEMYLSKGVDVAAVLNEVLSKPVKADKRSLCMALKAVKKGLLQYSEESKKLYELGTVLLQKIGNIPSNNLTGSEKKDFYKVIHFHDRLAEDSLLYSWMTTYDTKYMTKHSLEINRLKKKTEGVLAGEWIKTILEFFISLNRFNEYQLPLLNEALESCSSDMF